MMDLKLVHALIAQLHAEAPEYAYRIQPVYAGLAWVWRDDVAPPDAPKILDVLNELIDDLEKAILRDPDVHSLQVASGGLRVRIEDTESSGELTASMECPASLTAGEDWISRPWQNSTRPLLPRKD